VRTDARGARHERLVGNARGDAVQCIRADGANLPLVGIERHGEIAFALHPIIGVEALLEFFGVTIEVLGFIAAVEPPQDLRQIQLGGVDDALLLAGRRGFWHLRSVVIDDGILGILPALIFDALLGPRLILVEAIMRATFVEPAQRGDRGLKQRRDERLVRRPMPELGDHKRIKARGRHRAVVACLRNIIECGERPGMRFMQHPAGLLIAPRVLLPALPGREDRQRSAHEVGRDGAASHAEVKESRPNSAT